MGIPSTSPTQFEPEIAKETFKRMTDLNPARILLTHYGELEDIHDAYAQLNEWIDFSEQMARKRFREGIGEKELIDTLREDIWSYFDKTIKNARGSGLTGEDREYLFLDAHLNAMGLAFYARTMNT